LVFVYLLLFLGVLDVLLWLYEVYLHEGILVFARLVWSKVILFYGIAATSVVVFSVDHLCQELVLRLLDSLDGLLRLCCSVKLIVLLFNGSWLERDVCCVDINYLFIFECLYLYVVFSPDKFATKVVTGLIAATEADK